MDEKNELLQQLDRLHTTEMGADRIRKNLQTDAKDVVAYCREIIKDSGCTVTRNGKNRYCQNGTIRLTVNAGSATIITAYRIK